MLELLVVSGVRVLCIDECGCILFGFCDGELCVWMEKVGL